MGKAGLYPATPTGLTAPHKNSRSARIQGRRAIPPDMCPIRSPLGPALLALGVFLSPLTAAQAQSWQRPDFGNRLNSDQAQDRVERGALRPFREIVADLEGRFGGRYLSHRLFDGRPPVYEVDWLRGDGRRVTVRVNAESGALLGVSG